MAKKVDPVKSDRSSSKYSAFRKVDQSGRSSSRVGMNDSGQYAGGAAPRTGTVKVAKTVTKPTSVSSGVKVTKKAIRNVKRATKKY